MKRTTISLLITSVLCSATSSTIAQGLGSGSLFSRVDDQATKVTQAYAAIYENFYGVGKSWLMLKAALDVRPDGTPNITLDREAQKAQFTIRLSVNEPVYNAWKEDAHRRIEAVGMSVKFSDFEDTEARVIGGKFYRLGDNEESALRRWESSDKPAKKAELVVRVELVDSNGNAVRKVDLPISEFRRLGFDAFPLPLHHLNRLQDLPLDRYKWGNLDGMRRSLSDALRKADPNASIDGDSVEAIRRALAKAEENLDPSKRFKWGDVEDAYATFTLTGLTDFVMNSIVDVRCSVIDDEILMRERAEAERIARERAESAARVEREKAAAAARIAHEKAEAERKVREEAARVAQEKAEAERKAREEAARIAKEKREFEEKARRKAVLRDILETMIAIPGKRYLIGKYEVTQKQWKVIMGNCPSTYGGDDYPVNSICWNDCQAFLTKLNAEPIIRKLSITFRLPTRDEWVYACLAGSKRDFCKLSDGTIIKKETLDKVAWYEQNSQYHIHPVGEKMPNAFGLYDMHGNVEEFLSTQKGELPEWTDTPNNHVIGGGSYSSLAVNCSAEPRGSPADWRSDTDYGFRLCVTGNKDQLEVVRKQLDEEKQQRSANVDVEQKSARQNDTTQIAQEKKASQLQETQNGPIQALLASMVQIPGKDYWMGKYEVTQSQWEAVMGNNPARFKCADNPVENVSWDDCQEFLKRLNALPVVQESGYVFRLPADAEWEYACRAGSTGNFCKLPNGTEITEGTLEQVAWFDVNSDKKAHPVGQKEPNAYGLYDMHGNVYEWCQDEFGEVTNYAKGTEHEHDRVLRGGSWVFKAMSCRSSHQFRYGPEKRFGAIGFRLCAEKR